MARFLTILLAATFTILIGGQQLNAQEAQEPDRTLLPDIDPQDIEIRSQFEARFPGLRRQPILGFNPEPRVFQVDPDRRPFIEDEEAVAASVPVAELDRPDPPEYQALTYAEPRNGFARTGFGTYLTPEADIYAIAGLGRGQWISTNLDYRSTDGHLDDQNSAFRKFNADIRSQHRLSDRSAMRFNVNAFSDFNYLPISRTVDELLAGDQGRTEVHGVDFRTDIMHARNVIAGLDISAGGYFHQFDMIGSSTNTGGTPSEWGASTTFDYTWPGSNVEEVYGVTADIRMGETEALGAAPEFWTVSQAGVTYNRLFNYQTDVKATFGGAFVSDASESGAFYVTPKIEVRHTLFEGLDLRGLMQGSPDHRSMREVHNKNRFVNFEDPLRHHYTARALGEIISEPLSGTAFTGGISYQRINNYSVFDNSRVDGAGTELLGAYDINYSDASIMKVYGGFSQQLVPNKFWVDIDAYWQRPRLANGEGEIPFVEAIGAKGSVSWRPASQVLVEGWANFAGSRFNPNGDDLSSYFLLGSKFEFSLGRNFGIYGKLLNITDQQYQIWDGYDERGFQGYVGITVLF